LLPGGLLRRPKSSSSLCLSSSSSSLSSSSLSGSSSGGSSSSLLLCLGSNRGSGSGHFLRLPLDSSGGGSCSGGESRLLLSGSRSRSSSRSSRSIGSGGVLVRFQPFRARVISNRLLLCLLARLHLLSLDAEEQARQAGCGCEVRATHQHAGG